jgi:hypothetical protein
MNRNIKALVQACGELGVEYEVAHATGNLVAVVIGGRRYVFSNWATPLNSHSVAQLCQDKEYFYSFYKDVVRMPMTRGYLAPHIDERYANYLECGSLCEIVADVESAFGYPLIVKKNRGSWGRNVFKVGSAKELERALLEVFNYNSASFDYVALVQEYIEIEQEFRAVFLGGTLEMVYEKVTDGASFVDNLSPLHWEGARAAFVKEKRLLEEISRFCAPMFEKMMIDFCGVDIAIDRSGEMWFIEANSSPGFDYIIKSEGEEEVVALYRRMLEYLQKVGS